MACDVLEIAALLAVVRDRAHGPLRIEPFDASRAIRALARVVPEAGIRAAEAEHRVLRALERDVVDVDLEREQHDVRVEEEIEIDMADVERERRAVAVGDHDLADIVAPIDPQARLALRAAPGRCRPSSRTGTAGRTAGTSRTRGTSARGSPRGRSGTPRSPRATRCRARSLRAPPSASGACRSPFPERATAARARSGGNDGRALDSFPRRATR